MEAFKIQSLAVFLFLGIFAPLCCAKPTWILTPDQIYPLLETHLSHKKGDYFKRTVRRVGNQTIELEGFSSLSGRLENFYSVAKDIPHYRQWALTGLNKKPAGGEYLLQILDLRVDPQKSNVLHALFGLRFPGIHQDLRRSFLIIPTQQPRSVTVSCQSLDAPDLVLSSLVGYITAFSAPKDPERLWVYFKGVAKIRSWILYQALPERLLTQESSERIQTVLDNFSQEEVKQYALVERSNRVKTPKKKRQR